MKFGVGALCIAFGYAILYQGIHMTRWYDPKTGSFPPGNVPPLSVLLGFRKAPKTTDTGDNANVQPPFNWDFTKTSIKDPKFGDVPA